MHTKWKIHIDFIQENLNSLSPEEMAEKLGVDLYALKLFLHQHRFFPQQTERNILLEILTLKFGDPEYFKPTRNFLDTVGIGQKRYWQIYRGEKKMTEHEYLKTATHLNVSLQDAFELRQLKIF